MGLIWYPDKKNVLILKGDEYEDMIERYLASIPELDVTKKNMIVNAARNYSWFLKSEHDVTGWYDTDFRNIESDHLFGIEEFDEQFDNVHFVSFMTKISAYYDTGDEPLYTLEAETNIKETGAFDEDSVSEYAALVDEFKQKLEHYLPDDFNWDTHIGVLTYSC